MFDFTDRIKNIKIGVLGDFALDIYWHADMKKSELSRETPHFPLPVYEEKISLGAAGNVAANISALSPSLLSICSVCGNDWRGKLLFEKLCDINADTRGLIVEEKRFTNAYCKPIKHGISETVYEDPRIDFSATEKISKSSEKSILEWLDCAEKELDFLCVCDQFENGVITEKIIERLSTFKKPTAVDSRSRAEKYKNVIIKPNEHECAAALARLNQAISEDAEENAKRLCQATGSCVLLTLGENGCIFTDGNNLYRQSAIEFHGETDICGAGDTFISAFSSSYAAGADIPNALSFASCASYVTIQKIGETGTATLEEIKKAAN